MAELEEVDGSQGQGAQGAGQVQAGQTAQGPSQGGSGQTAQGSSQGGAGQTAQGGVGQEGLPQRSQEQEAGMPTQTPPQLPPRALRLSSVQDITIMEYIAEIKAKIGTSTKNIQMANYQLTSIDKMVPQVSRALSQKQNPKGPVV